MTVTDDMVDRAMNASIPGGSQAWVWLFNCAGGMAPEERHRDFFRRVLEAALRAEAGAVGSAEIEAGAEAAWSMTPRGVPWGDASDHIQNEWRRIAKTILTAALAQARRTDRA